MQSNPDEMSVIERPASGSESPPTLAEAAAAWVARLAVGEIGAAEMARLRAWLEADDHRRAFDEARRAWQVYPAAEAAAAMPPRRRRGVDRRPSAATIPARRAGARIAMVGGLAASLVAALLVAQRPAGDLHTARGEVRAVRLADGTTAWLDTDSAVNLRFSAGERRVELVRGRAWFDVVHDPRRPFRVAALGAVVTDVGTAFEVERLGGEAKVGVSQGVVAVRDGGGAALLTVGRSTSWGARGGRLRPVVAFDPEAALAWRSGRIVLDRVPLARALDEIRRYRPGLILLLDDKAARTPVSGALFTGRLDEGLDTLAAGEGLSIIRLPYLVVLRPDDRRFGPPRS